MTRDYHMKTTPGSSQPASFKTYLIGFILSLLMTISAYALVAKHLSTQHFWPPDDILLPFIIILALVQFAVQLKYFLHLGKESRPRWKLLVFGFMSLIVAILVFGSLWIMTNLNYHISPTGSETFIIKDEGIHK